MYAKDRTFSYISVYNNGRNEPCWDDMVCNSPFGKLPPELETIKYIDECAKRNSPKDSLAASAGARRPKKLGIVVVVCREQLWWLSELDCTDKNIYVYSKCGRSAQKIRSSAGGGKECLSVIEAPETLWDAMVYTKMHSDYLRHMADRYSELEDHMLFLKGNFMLKRGQRHVNLDIASVVAEALTGKWDFKPLGSVRSMLWTHFDRNPFQSLGLIEMGAAAQEEWGRELCTLFKRYTCESECYTCHFCEAPVCFRAQTKGMFIVSAARVRTLPRSEYVWLRQWLNSWDKHGVQRRFMMDSLWGAMFGCNAHGHGSQDMTSEGCAAGQAWSGEQMGKQTDPPQEFIDSGQVAWPLPDGGPAGGAAPPVPNFPATTVRLAFVAVLPPSGGSADTSLISAMFLTAMRSHPDGHLILLHPREADVARTELDIDFWAGKLRLVEVPRPSRAETDEAYTLSMQIRYLESLAQMEDPGAEALGGLVMLSPGAVITGNLRPTFAALGSSAGFALLGRGSHQATDAGVLPPHDPTGRPSRKARAETSIWFVGTSGIQTVAPALSKMWEHAQHEADAGGGAASAVHVFSKAVALRVETGTTAKTSILRPLIVGLACDMFAGRGGDMAAHADEMCHIRKTSVALKIRNATDVQQVWSWMQVHGSVPYALAQAYQSLVMRRRDPSAFKTYVDILYDGDNQL